jgi:serine protease Do
MLSRSRHAAAPWALALTLGLASVAPGARADLPDFKTIIRANEAAVVNITATREAVNPRQPAAMPGEVPPGFEEFFRRFGGPQGKGPSQARGLGSGFIISADGEILTNAHVVEGATTIVVKLADDTEQPARLVGIDPATDVALLKIEGRGLPTVKLGDSSGVEVGDWVLAIGSPFGLERTATQGIVSAIGRSLPDGTYVPFIQTDAAVNPGNSGGPLFNTRGEVIGINSQIYSRDGGYMGLSFAIPVNVATGVARQLAATGSVERGWLGVGIQTLNADLARSFGLPKPRGALVGQVDATGPAARAGLKSGDVILAFNGKPVANSAELPLLVADTRPGTSVQVTVWRDRREQQLPLTVARLKPATAAMLETNSEDGGRGALGLNVAPLSPAQRAETGIAEGGLLVVGVGAGPAEKAGIEAGDIILQAGPRTVADPDQLATAIRTLPKGEPLALLVQRNSTRLFMPVTIG